MSRAYRNLEERLVANSYVDAETGCWIWVGRAGGGATRGYGRINVRRDGRHVTELAHRAAYCELVGPIPSGMTVDHMCCNSLCINPQHLQLVTKERNSVLRWTRATAAVAASEAP